MSGYTVYILHKTCGYLVPSSKGLYVFNLRNIKSPKLLNVSESDKTIRIDI